MYIYTTKPLGDRWFKCSPSQTNAFPYLFSGPPIRPLWIGRGRTSLSPNHIKRPAGTSKSATLLPTSLLCFFLFSYSRLAFCTVYRKL